MLLLMRWKSACLLTIEPTKVDVGCVLVATVLMIGDHTDTVRLVRMALEFSSYGLLVSATLEDSVSVLGEHEIQLLMIENSAFSTAAKKLLSLPPDFSNIPKIVFFENDNIGGDYLKIEINDRDLILMKPFTPLKLHRAIDSILNNI
jgi:DNA-binding NtrC family response regulator